MNKQSTPPRLPLRFFRWFCRPEYVEDIEGDLLERFEGRVEKQGFRRAKWLFAIEVAKLFRAGIVRQFGLVKILNRQTMLQHYATVTFRNWRRNKVFSAVNLSGLVMGMVSSLILAKYAGFVLSYDQFHVNRDQIVQIDQEERKNGVLTSYQHDTYWQTALLARERYPEVLMASRYSREVEQQLTVAGENGALVKFNERNIFSADPDFTRMFTFQFLKGDPATALSQPNTVVITRAVAEKYFGNIEVLGKTMRARTAWAAESVLQVTGVVENLPVYSRFQFDFLESSVGDSNQDQWGFAAYPTYLLLGEAAFPPALADKMSHDINHVEQLQADQRKVKMKLVPLNAARLSESEIMLGLVGMFILLITWINFVNLTSAQSLSRYRETGIRKVLGSGRGEILRQFIFEGMFVNLLAILAAVLIVWLIYPLVQAYTNGRMLPLFHDPSPINWIFLSLFLAGAMLASLYPALVLSVLDPVRSFKGQVWGQAKGIGFRQVLVTVQFCISIVLITGIFVISDQMNFIRNQDLGIKLDHTLVVSSPKDQWEGKLNRRSAFKNIVADLSFIRGVASSTQTPGGGNGQDIVFSIEGKNFMVNSHLIGIDARYMSYYGARFIAGEDFSAGNVHRNMRSALVNRSAAIAMGCARPEEALGQSITIPENEDKTMTVIGVVEDFHLNSLKEKIEPLVFEFNAIRGNTSIKIDSAAWLNFGEIRQYVAQIEQIWNNIYPDQVFEYYFLDEKFNSDYQADIRFGQLFGVFTGISVSIACLGLFGMAIFIAQKKRKQVGIRKVFGASVLSIVALFCRGYFGQLLIAMLAGLPVAYLLMDKWLDSYVLRTSVSLRAMALPVILLAIVSFLSISSQVLKSARANPVDILRDE